MRTSQGLPEPLATGSRGDYKWMSSSHHQLDDLLRLCPNIVLGKYVAVTSFDSGPLVPNADERQVGWDNRQGIAYSPRVTSVETLPRDLYDEWYVFAQPVDLGVSRLGSNIFDPSLKPGEVGDFVNYNFALHRSGMKDLAGLFWEQLERMRPESYIADNECLTFVTRDESLFAAVAKALGYPSD